MKDILDRIKKLRINQGLTQSEIADRLDISHNGYVMIEGGKRGLDIPKLRQIAEILDVPVSCFFQDEEVFNLYLLPKKDREKIEKEASKHKRGSEQLINIDKLRKLSDEITFNAKEGMGLVNLEYDIIRETFKPIYKELKELFDADQGNKLY